MAFAQPRDRPPARQDLDDGRLAGLRLALRQFEVPASNGVFDDLLCALVAVILNAFFNGISSAETAKAEAAGVAAAATH